MMLGVNCRTSSSSCYSPSHLNSSGAEVGLWRSMLNASPRLSSHSNMMQIVQVDGAFPDQDSLYWNTQKIEGCNSMEYIPSDATPVHKTSIELKNEIAILEIEIMRLERYLLSLYRTAFEEHMSTLSSVSEIQSKRRLRSPSQNVAKESIQRHEQRNKRNNLHMTVQSSPAHCWVSSDCEASDTSLASRKEQKNSHSGRRSLGDLFSASCTDASRSTPDRLSEDIARCISSIYCKLANPSQVPVGSSASPTSSLSSSSIFSSHNPRDSWSPCRNEDTFVQHQLQALREDKGMYTDTVEILKICLDDDRFQFAATMLQKFRSLVRNLEKVDPSKMKREEKLAFWINIHNALVMHAYLAYGTSSRSKTNNMFKAAYNVGGHCINAYVIQSSILGIRSPHSAPWIQSLFSPGRKSKISSTRHVYALEYPEPLVHFALCSGAYSDPLVRVYTAKTIFYDLRLAKEDFIQANVYIHKETKVFLPRMLYYYAKDMSLTMPGLLDIVNNCLSEVQQKSIKTCMKGKLDKHIHWLPHNSTFRYVIHGELARDRISI